MTWQELVGGLVGFFSACTIGSFAEYLVHVLMHRRLLKGKVHTAHHKDGWGQGVWGEFVDYFLPALPIPVILSVSGYFLGFWGYGIGMWLGYLFICFFCAYCHQASHERPELMFWMRQPQHHVHHRDNDWWHNYGVSSDIWDRLFRTYKKVAYTPAKRFWQLRPRDFFRLKWI